jgi:D-serine deaminase-like pyridoxal phosphate-dependent protein
MPELVPTTGAIQETRDRVKRAYGSAIGRNRRDLITPALVLDLPAARRNIATMADRLKTMPAKLRPHIKVHKSPELALMQLEAGAIGISTATVWEAIVMVRSGLDSIFIVNTLAGREKLAALAEIARDAEVMVAVDNAENAADIAAAACAAGTTVGVLIEVDTGMDRAGVDTARQAVELARRITRVEGIKLLGVTGYEGHCMLIPDRDSRVQAQQAAMHMLVDVAEKIRGSGLPCTIVSAGGTGTWDLTAATRGVTEIQAGSYAVMDNFHFPMAGDFEHALTVLTTVISRPPERVIVDAGNKSLGAPALSTMRGHGLTAMRFDEEHGIFIADSGYPLKVGDVVELLPGYAPGTVNWYDAYYVVDGERVVDVWPVIPRGPGHGGLIS